MDADAIKAQTMVNVGQCATETPEFGEFPATETVLSGDAVSNAIMAQGSLL